MTARVGLFGGSFDPIHNGHVIMAGAACDCLALDRLFLVPTAVPPHKPDGPHAAIADRIDMARAALMGESRIEIAEWESADTVAYTVDTLRRLCTESGPEAERFLVVGGDSLRDFRSWRDPEGILRLATLAVYARPGTAGPDAPVSHRRIDGPLLDVSSTDIRERVRAGRSIRGFVPESVAAIIRARRLYGG